MLIPMISKRLIIIVISFSLFAPCLSPSNVSTSQENSKYQHLINDDLFSLQVQMYMKLLKMPSLAACVIKDDQKVFADSYGYKNFYLREEASIDTLYVVGSISKTITATAVMQLWEQGLFDLDDNVSQYLPFDFKNPFFPEVNITFRMLLSHQSSMVDTIVGISYFLPLLEDKLTWVKDRVHPDGKYYNNGENWRHYPPGALGNYSNTPFVLLAYIVENLTGTRFDQYCDQHIFTPLEMNATSFELQKVNINDCARPYLPILNGVFIPIYHYDTKCVSPCAGLRTTAEDLSHFFIAHMNNGQYKSSRILTNETITEMHRIQYPDNPEEGRFYGGTVRNGLGWGHIFRNGKHWQGYNGGGIGYCCNMIFDTETNIGVILLSNKHVHRIPQPLGPQRYDWFEDLTCLFLQKAR